MTSGSLAQLACVLEVTSRKPGNVHRYRDFADTSYLDFLLSAQALAGPLDRATEIGIGRSVLDCVIATQKWVDNNTNLGMILLLAPLAAVPSGLALPQGVRDVLAATMVEDSRLVYEAIRRAKPGGLGSADIEDVHKEPTISLVETMRLAADRDIIARQYTTGFDDIFEVAVPSLRSAIVAGKTWETAVVRTFLEFLARTPDTLIARKLGSAEAEAASRKADEVLQGGWPDHREGIERFRSFDLWLREEGHGRNPGATADIIAATLFVALRDGTIRLPLENEPGDHF